jgi:hypothetical protein
MVAATITTLVLRIQTGFGAAAGAAAIPCTTVM